jgi:hypothetical protein
MLNINSIIFKYTSMSMIKLEGDQCPMYKPKGIRLVIKGLGLSFKLKGTKFVKDFIDTTIFSLLSTLKAKGK